MGTRHVKLVDESRAVLATAEVADEGGYFGGTIDLRAAPAPLRALFDEFEEIVNGQMFAFLDEAQGKIDSLPIKAVFADGFEAPVKDLQVFPSASDVSFRLAGAPSQPAKQATG
jgi:hypothetical protein